MNPSARVIPPPSGRDVLLVGGMAVMALGVLNVVSRLSLRPQDADPVVAMGLAVTGVLALWSLVLACRRFGFVSLRTWALASVMALVAVDGYAVRSSYIDLNNPFVFNPSAPLTRCGFHIFVPVFILVALLATPISWGVLRWTARRRAARNLEAHPPRQSGRLLALYFAGACLVLILLVLPGPLLLFCAYMNHWDTVRSRSHWDTHCYSGVCNYTPSFIGEAASEALLSSRIKTASILYACVLEQGCVSAPRLKAELYAGNPAPYQSNAFRGLFHQDPERACSELNSPNSKVQACAFDTLMEPRS